LINLVSFYHQFRHQFHHQLDMSVELMSKLTVELIVEHPIIKQQKKRLLIKITDFPWEIGDVFFAKLGCNKRVN